jgi:hypothetical protein
MACCVRSTVCIAGVAQQLASDAWSGGGGCMDAWAAGSKTWLLAPGAAAAVPLAAKLCISGLLLPALLLVHADWRCLRSKEEPRCLLCLRYHRVRGQPVC